MGGQDDRLFQGLYYGDGDCDGELYMIRLGGGIAIRMRKWWHCEDTEVDESCFG